MQLVSWNCKSSPKHPSLPPSLSLPPAPHLPQNIGQFDEIGPCVIMASPGMMQTGLSRQLFEAWCTDKRNGVIIAGYCVEGTLAKVRTCTFSKCGYAYNRDIQFSRVEWVDHLYHWKLIMRLRPTIMSASDALPHTARPLGAFWCCHDNRTEATPTHVCRYVIRTIGGWQVVDDDRPCSETSKEIPWNLILVAMVAGITSQVYSRSTCIGGIVMNITICFMLP